MDKNKIEMKAAKVYSYRNSSRNQTIKLNTHTVSGRPVVFYKKLIQLGMEKEYINSKFIEDIIVFGFDKKYWADVNVLAGIIKFALTDSQTEKRLKELEEDG